MHTESIGFIARSIPHRVSLCSAALPPAGYVPPSTTIVDDGRELEEIDHGTKRGRSELGSTMHADGAEGDKDVHIHWILVTLLSNESRNGLHFTFGHDACRHAQWNSCRRPLDLVIDNIR